MGAVKNDSHVSSKLHEIKMKNTNQNQIHLVFGEAPIVMTKSKAYRRLSMWVSEGYDKSIFDIEGTTLFEKFSYVLEFDAETLCDRDGGGTIEEIRAEGSELYWVANALIQHEQRKVA